jgi:hypothetical protein
MCGKKPKAPKVVQRDPVKEAEAAANAAAVKANAETANRRRRRQESSLLAAAGAKGVGGKARASLLAQASGKDTLGA